jgi:hypothetical protein
MSDKQIRDGLWGMSNDNITREEDVNTFSSTNAASMIESLVIEGGKSHERRETELGDLTLRECSVVD